MIASNNNHTTDRWLAGLGFRFNPFLQWEASTDPYLNEYLVGHEFFFAVAWDETPALIFAPAGGGKTAMRIYTARSCWVGLGGAHPFPISYLPTLREDTSRPPGAHEHLRGLVRAGVSALLIGLAYRPDLFLRLDAADQRAVATLLNDALPSRLSRYTHILREEATPLAILPLLDRSYRLPGPPDQQTLLALCDALDEAYSSSSKALPLAGEQFDIMVALLLGPLAFQSVLLLLDGADATPETISAPNAMADWLSWPFGQAAAWARQRVYLKGFVPSEASSILNERLNTAAVRVRQAHLKWEPVLLAELIRRRVYASTEGKFGSLDAISSPDLRDVDTQLAQAALALPREVLVLVSRVLELAARRPTGRSELERADLDAAISWYQAVRPDANRRLV